MATGYGSAPGKVILSGEHSVVYGFPAIVAAIGLRCQVTANDDVDALEIVAHDLNLRASYSKDDLIRLHSGKRIHPKLDNIAVAATEIGGNNLQAHIEITSKIPVGAGLGSSAAVSVATICALADMLDKQPELDEISKMAYSAEKIAHGTPSGIDNTIATYGGFLRFQDGRTETKQSKVSIPLIIINTRIPRNTRHLVSGVRELRNKHPQVVNNILNAMGEVTKKFELAFDKGALVEMGELFNINQGLLEAIGVGHPRISEIINSLDALGAIGSKLTGAGGGGCVIALSYDTTEAGKIAKGISSTSIDVYQTEITPYGARIGE